LSCNILGRMVLYLGTKSVLLLFLCSITFSFCQEILFVFNGSIVSVSFKSTFIFPNGILNDCMFYEGQLILERAGKCFCICFIVLSYSSFQFECFRGQKRREFCHSSQMNYSIRLHLHWGEWTEHNRSSLPVVSSLLIKLCFSLYSLWSNFDCTMHSSMQPFLLWHCVMLLC